MDDEILAIYNAGSVGMAKPSAAALNITTQPQSQTVMVGSTVTFSVTATGSEPLSYQWRKDGTNLVDGGRTSGSTSFELRIANCELADAGNFTRVVSNAFGVVTIAPPVVLTVKEEYTFDYLGGAGGNGAGAVDGTGSAARFFNTQDVTAIAAGEAHTVALAGPAWEQQSFALASAPSTPLTGEKAIEHLKATGQYESLAAAITAARYAVKPMEAGTANPKSEIRNPKPSAVWAQNRAHGIRSTFSPDGLTFTVRTGGGADASAHTVGWRLRSLGYGAAQIPVPPGELKVSGQRVEITRGSALPVPHSELRVPHLVEWFQNTPAGLEHGFTLPERPAANPRAEPLLLILVVTGDLTPQVEGCAALVSTSAPDAVAGALARHDGASTVTEPLGVIERTLASPRGRGLEHAKERVHPKSDAAGQSLALRDAAGRTVLTYAKLKVWDATGAELPASMQVADGQVTLAVTDSTARYPLTIDPTFTQQTYLKGSNTDAEDYFGGSVAVSGDTVVVGAEREDSSATGVNGASNDSASLSGAAYVFVRSGTTWSQQAYLKASNTQGTDIERGDHWGDHFGCSVAVSGDTVVVGARSEDSSATGVNGNQTDNSARDSGAAYVFVRSGTTWTQQAYLKASNTEAGDLFGASVAVSGNTVVVGALSEDSSATGVNGNQGNNSASGSGAAYVFVRSGTTWTQQVYLKASNTAASDYFGCSVAVSGDTVVVGAFYENGSGGGNSGAAYVFVRSGTTWTQQAYLKASNTGADDQFGCSVAVSGDTLVVGANQEDSSATGVNGNQSDNSAANSGAVYVFVRGGTTWTQQAYLKASNTEAGDGFAGVAVSGDTVVVGAGAEDSNATGVNGDGNDNSAANSGAAYVFVRIGTTWTQQAYLKASNTGAGDNFGGAAVSGDTVVVGAVLEDSAAGINGDGSNNSASNAGAAYVFLGPPVPPSITVQPQSQTVAQGANVTFTVSADGTWPMNYQWHSNSVAIANATNATLTLTNVQLAWSGIEYSVVITNSSGSITSQVATLTVNVPPTITAQPTNQAVTLGLTATFNVTATGTAPLTYQWCKDGTNLLNGGRISGATTANLTINGVQPSDAGNYTVVISNIAGSATSQAAALAINSSVIAWGSNSHGQINVPTGLSVVIAIAAGGYHSLALKSDGTVVAWGRNLEGQSTVPAGLPGVVAISAGGFHSVVLKSDGTVVAWGGNGWGQSTVPAGLSGVVAVAAAGGHSLALKSNGTVVAWGDNRFGQLMVPAGLSGVVAISANGWHSLALKNDGTVVAWGYNANGQTTVPAGLSGVIAIGAGGYHSLALKSDGTIVAWGWNSDGQTTVPAGLSGVVAIEAGGYNSLAVKSDGTVVAWGRNVEGQSTVPAGLSGVIAVSADGWHCLALKSASGPALPTLSINDVSVTEGNSGSVNATFTVTLSPASSQTVMVDFATEDGTATVAGNDYVASSGTLIFAPNETTKSVSIQVIGDTAVEPIETFCINLSNAVDATIVRGQGVGTINNDDRANNAPVATADNYSVDENQILNVAPQGLPLTKTKPINFFVRGFDVGDVDNDGAQEVVVTDPVNQRVAVYDAQFNLKYSLVFSEVPCALLIADLDGDAKNELVVGTSRTSNPDNPGHIFVGKFDVLGNFTLAWISPPHYFRFGSQLAAGDLNADGINELVLGGTWFDRKLVCYQYNGTTYNKVFEDPIGSDVNSVCVAGGLLIAGTANWADFGLRVYSNYSLVYSDLGAGHSCVAAGNLQGDGSMQIVRTLASKGTDPNYRPYLMVYGTQPFAVAYTSGQLRAAPADILPVAVGELVPGGGEEIAVGDLYYGDTVNPASLLVFQYDGSSYQMILGDTMDSPGEDIICVKIAAVEGEGRNQLLASTSTGLVVYSPSGGVGVLANDSDPDGDPLTAELVTGPAHGTLTLNADGSFVYKPDPDIYGVDTFTYKVNDGQLDSALATVTITVRPIAKATPVITWANPADIVYGTVLGDAQLNATANVPGTFAYTPAAGAVLNAGSGQTLSASFTPSDPANYTSASATAAINVAKATPVITWANPADIVYGTALGDAQLNATANVPGTFAYSPVAGTVLNAGNGQTLSVSFTPSDPANYTSASATVMINVAKATPVITWANPADIVYGTALGDVQLNATANVLGTFAYSPAAETVLNAGDGQTLSASFTPSDPANYTSASATVAINVAKATPVITWANPADIVYGTALGSVQLNATANVPGTFAYSPVAGTVLNAGNGQTLSASFTPNDPANYTSASASVLINILTASQATTKLADIVNSPNIPANAESELLASLETAKAAFDRGNNTAGVNQLQAFQNKVQAQAGKKIDPATVNDLILKAQEIIRAVKSI